jgi:ribosomal protein S18 acetylase RimI-like enzyme
VIELAVELVVESRSPYREGISDEQIRDFRKRNFEQLDSILELPEGGLFVASNEAGEHIGHILLLGNQMDSVTEARQAWVYDVSVRTDWQGRGVGRRLMAHGEEFARGLGLEFIGLGVTAANARAVDFYKDLDYNVERVQMIKRL